MDTIDRAKEQESYEAALKTAFAQLNQLRTRAKTGDRSPGDAAREVQLLDMIRVLAASLADWWRPSIQSEPAATVPDAIQQILRKQPQPRWTSKEIRRALERQGVRAEAKTVTNSIDYMVRLKRLRRLARGVYYDPQFGVGYITSDEWSGEPSRQEMED